jgi:aquaporin Z
MDDGEHNDVSPPEARQVGPEAPRPDLEARRMWGALLALENPGTLDFDNPALEWRRLFSEILGTFLLVLAGAGAGVVGAKYGGISRTAAVAAPGLTVMAIILFMGGVSGGI